MSQIFRLVLPLILVFAAAGSSAQTIVRGKIIDAATKEPVSGATITCTNAGCRCGCQSNDKGEFELTCTGCQNHFVSSVGYTSQEIPASAGNFVIALNIATSQLQSVVITANRGLAQKRSEAPIAISSISSKILQETKPASADQVLNKVSGVNMVNLGNEQHQMSIRQPMTTKSLFLYLEDGIPVRTSGLYNHNALLEMNLTATKTIEVIKGPSSSLYGSEAIGGVINFISAAPTAIPVLKLSIMGNNVGYNKAEGMASVSTEKFGIILSSYWADKRNGFLEYTDFSKKTITARIDYRFTNKTILTSSLTYLDYYSDMAGGIDSTMFANRTFTNLHSFTYRKVNAFRFHSTLNQIWNNNSKTTITALFRNNSIGQNPAYRVKDDYRKINGVFKGNKELAHGEVNQNKFNSYCFLAQHRQNLNWKKAVLIGGVNLDLSPSAYTAEYIRIKKDSPSKKYTGYQTTDSTMTNYETWLKNYAAFLNFEIAPLEKLRVVASLRYDYFHYGFDNHLKPSAFSGSSDTVNNFYRFSPKIGFTYNFSTRSGIYANYSEGFVPPQVTELYSGVKVPDLDPSIFYNYEIGGWVEIIKKHLSADVSAYRLKGTNEIISVKLEDGSFANQNAGITLHRGIEFGLNATPVKEISFRFSGAYSNHEFKDFTEKGLNYTGNEMSNAPNWNYNTEVWLRPSKIKGLRIGMELQHVGSYFVDPQNTARYNGYSTLNIRAGYQAKAFEIWLNVLNATNNYYSHITTKSSFGYSYQLAEPINFNLGLSYDFGTLFNKKK